MQVKINGTKRIAVNRNSTRKIMIVFIRITKYDSLKKTHSICHGLLIKSNFEILRVFFP